MKILPFPKDRWTGGPCPEATWQDNLVRGGSEPDDFQQEIELTRRNEPLMMLLDDRAKHSAAVSLEEIKQRLANVFSANGHS